MFPNEEEKKFQIRSTIRFLVLKNLKRREIITELHRAYGTGTIKKTAIYKWIKIFESGETSIKDLPRKGRKRKIDEMKKEDVQTEILKYRKITSRDLVLKTGMSKGSIYKILKELGIFYHIFQLICSRL